MLHDPVRVAEVRAWLIKAARDLQAAGLGLHTAPPLLEDVVFHSQQAVEKVMKGFLTWHDQPFRKTHSLEEIGEQCIRINAGLRPCVDQAVPLTEYAWKFRYPGEYEPLTPEEAQETLVIARTICDAIMQCLPDEVRPST